MTFNYPSSVSLVEVGARDGLQNEKAEVTTEQKVTLISLLAASGLKRIEAGSFGSPKWVPQMADSADVFARLAAFEPASGAQVAYSALTPNVKGLEAALSAGVDEVAIFGSASESFSQKNINCSIDESLRRFEPVVKLAHTNRIRVRGYVSCTLGCPYEGGIASSDVARVSRQLSEMGCYEVVISDTIGTGTPVKTARVLDAVMQHVPVNQLAVHFHDTYGQALANIHTALQLGVSSIDSAIAGLSRSRVRPNSSSSCSSRAARAVLSGSASSSTAPIFCATLSPRKIEVSCGR